MGPASRRRFWERGPAEWWSALAVQGELPREHPMIFAATVLQSEMCRTLRQFSFMGAVYSQPDRVSET